jgi:hypothetical protein
MAYVLPIVYGVGAGADTVDPQVLSIRGAKIEDAEAASPFFEDSDNETIYYRNNKAEVYLLFDAFKLTGTPMREIKIAEGSSETEYFCEEMGWIPSDNLETRYLAAFPLTSLNGRTRVKYSIQTKEAGPVKLYLLPEDILGNKITRAEAESGSYYITVVIDPPPESLDGGTASYNKGTETIQTSWTPPTDPDVTEIQVIYWVNDADTDDEAEGTIIHIPAADPRFTAGTCTISDDGQAENNYKIQIKALDDKENYSLLPAALSVRADAKPPEAPGNFSALYSQSAHNITLTWNDPAAEDLEKILVYWTKNGLAPLPPPESPHELSPGLRTWVIPDVDHDSSEYKITLTAVDQSGNESTPSAERTIRPTGSFVPPVSGLNLVYDSGASTIAATWEIGRAHV